MKKMKGFFERYGGLLLLVLMAVASVFGIVDTGVMTADVVVEPNGGVAEVGGNPESVEFAQENVEDLILHTIDKNIVKIEPYNFQIDTIARHIKNQRHSDGQIVDYYTSSFLPAQTRIATAVTTPAAQATLNFTDNWAIGINDTLIANNIPGYLPGTTTPDPAHNLVLYVVDRDTTGAPVCVAINGSGAASNIPTLAVDTVFTRSGRAASELQIRTDIYTALPTKGSQFLQKFIIEIEESTFFGMANKEVPWTISDQLESALTEFRRQVTHSYWRGDKVKRKVKNKYNRKAEDTYFTEGIWSLAGGDFSFGGVSPTTQSLVDLMEMAFSGPSSSNTKWLLCSAELMAAIAKTPYTQVIYPGSQQQIYGFDVSTIISPFGKVFLSLDKSLTEIGLGGKGFVLDTNYMAKWSMGWRSIPVDNVANGDADSKGRILTEASALTLYNPAAHIRVSLS
jgi:hypothetical protein